MEIHLYPLISDNNAASTDGNLFVPLNIGQ